MIVTYKNKKLKKYAEDNKFSVMNIGKDQSALYMKRVGDFLAAETLEDLRYVPGRYHELIGDRKGQFSCDLSHPYRLIFEPHEFPIPTDADGKYVWNEIKGVNIIEIADYH